MTFFSQFFSHSFSLLNLKFFFPSDDDAAKWEIPPLDLEFKICEVVKRESLQGNSLQHGIEM